MSGRTQSAKTNGRRLAPPSFQRRQPGAFLVGALALLSLSAAPSKETFTGSISDDMCAKAGHSSMQMGPNDAECTKACVALHGATYVLVSGKDVYQLSDQTRPERFAGQKVTVSGTLDARSRTIHVLSIAAAK